MNMSTDFCFDITYRWITGLLHCREHRNGRYSVAFGVEADACCLRPLAMALHLLHFLGLGNP